MMFEGPIDLVEVDRKIARAHEAAVRALGSLATEEGRELARRADPFRSVREVTGQTAFRAIQSRELPAGSIDAPLRDGLLRWVHELLQTRVAWDLFADEADATHLPDPTLNPRAADGVPKTYDESLTALVVASHERAAEAAYRRLADLALPVSATT